MAYSARSGGSGKRKPGGSSSTGRGSKSFGRKSSGDKPPFKRRDDARPDERPFGRGDDKPAFKRSSSSSRTGDRKPFGDKPAFKRRDDGDDKPAFKRRDGDDRRSSSSSSRGDRKPYGDKPAFKRRSDGDDKPAFKRRSDDDRPPFKRRSDGDDKPAFKRRSDDDRPAFKRSSSDRKPYGDKPAFKRRSDGDDKPRFPRERSRSSSRDDDRTGTGSSRERDDESRDDNFVKKPFGDKPFGEKPAYRGKREEGGDRRSSRSDSSSRSSGGDRDGFKKRSFGGDSKPTWKKGGSSTGRSGGSDRPFTSRKRHEDSGESEWKVFDKKEEASEFVERSAPRKAHRGQADEIGDGKIRLNKYIANTGLCSRREADDMIEAGVIKVNGKIVTELGTKIDSADVVHYGDQLLRREKLVYILLNKPKDYITTTDDPQERKTVLDLIAGACSERVYPVGRLDRNTTGVLLLTNDGDLAERLMHPKYGVEKIYQVSLDMNLKKEDFDKVLEGVELEDGFIKADDLSFVDDGEDKKQVGIVLHSGRNRIVRRLFEHLGYTVNQLDRVGYAGLTKKNVPKGRWRMLEPKEVGFLKMKVGGDKPVKKSFSKRK